MAVKTAGYASPISQDTSRGPSPSIWYNFDTPDYQQDPANSLGGSGKEFWDDFDGFPDLAGTQNAEQAIGRWDTWLSSTNPILGTAADTTNLPLEGGVIGLSGGASGKQIVMAAGVPGFRLISPASGFPLQGRLAFECRVAIGALTTTTIDMFVGLADTGQGGSSAKITSADSKFISASNTLITTTSGVGACLGFHKRGSTNPGDWGVAFNVNNGTPQYPGSASNLQKLSLNYGGGALAALATSNGAATAGFIKLGFVFDPTPQRGPSLFAPAAITGNQTAGTLYGPLLKFYVNGQLASAFLISADVQASTFPSTFMVPVIAYRCGSTTTGAIGYVDWVRCAQAASF